MKKLSIIAVILAVALAFSACRAGGGGGAQSVQDGDAITLILGHAGSDTDPRATYSQRLKEIIEADSDGKITVEVHGNSTIGTWEEMIEGMQLGTTHIVIESLLALETYTDLSGVETAPFLYDNDEEFFNVWEGELGAEIKQAITADSGYAILGNMFRGARQLTTKTKVASLSDLRGLTVRTPSAPTMIATWEALGARAEALAWNEVYSALESGVLDGQENPLDAILFNSIYEVAPYIAETKHMFANYHFLMWNKYLESLPESYQKIITSAADKAGQEYTANTVANTQKYRSELAADGAIFTELTDRDAWVSATEPVRDGLPEQVRSWIKQINELNA